MADGLLTNKSIYIQGQFDNLIYITRLFLVQYYNLRSCIFIIFSFLFLITFFLPFCIPWAYVCLQIYLIVWDCFLRCF